MSDLISRSKIRNHIKEQINPYGKPFEGTTYEFGLKLMDYIDNMLDAYNVDKVMEELEEAKKNFSAGSLQTHYYWRGINDAIEIVKKGGVE